MTESYSTGLSQSKSKGNPFAPAFEKRRPQEKILEGQRILEFTGVESGENQFKKATTKFSFRDVDTGRKVCRTTNTTIAQNSMMVMMLKALLPGSPSFKEISRMDPEYLFAVVQQQRGQLFIAECEASANGNFTNIVQLSRAKEQLRLF